MTSPSELCVFIEAWLGVSLDRGGSGASLFRFVGERACALGLPSVEAYLAQVGGNRTETAMLVQAVTVNYTWFYRDQEQMEDLARLFRDAWPVGKKITIWIPGCATGEDAYSLAMLANQAGRSASVLGTDLNPVSVAIAREGRYGPWSLRELPARLRPFFVGGNSATSVVADEIRANVTFEEHNLTQRPRLPSGALGWDLILCRNVLIYFNRERADEVVERLSSSLAPGGWLVLGVSEHIQKEPLGIRRCRLGSRLALQRTGGPIGADPVPMTVGPPEAVPLSRMSVTAPIAIPSPTRALDLVSEGQRTMKTQLPHAISLFERARDVDPLCVEAHVHLGLAFHLLGDSLSALSSLRAALLLDPTMWPAAFYLALSHENLGQPAEAGRNYQRVIDTSEVPVALSLSGIFGDVSSWRSEVVALSRRRVAKQANQGHLPTGRVAPLSSGRAD